MDCPTLNYLCSRYTTGSTGFLGPGMTSRCTSQGIVQGSGERGTREGHWEPRRESRGEE